MTTDITTNASQQDHPTQAAGSSSSSRFHMSGHPAAPQAHRPYMHQQSAGLREYSASPLTRSSTDLSEGVTHEYEPDCDADGFRHPGNHHAEHHGEFSPGSAAAPRPMSKSGRSSGRPHPFAKRPSFNKDVKSGSFTFEHEPDVDAEGYRHHHENLSSPALRALQDVVVPLDPRAGRIVITPSPSLKPNFSPYRHIDELPNKSIEDFQDPIELHSHASMIYGVDESKAKDSSGPDWMEVEESTGLIDEAAHGDIHQEVSERPVEKKLPVDPTGRMIAPVGGIAGDRQPVGPTRSMRESDHKGIAGAYTADGEGSAGMPFDANSGEAKKEGDIKVQAAGTIAPSEITNTSTSPQTASQLPSLASSLSQPTKPRLTTPGPVEDTKRPENPLSQDGSAMTVPEEVADDRPEWLRAAEMMANNEHDKLYKSKLVIDERASEETLDFASAARANLIRNSKSERGASYPNLAELNLQMSNTADTADRQGVSHLPEKDLGGENPPTKSQARSDKFQVETESNIQHAKENVEPATAAKFLGLSAGAAAGASIGAAALMTSQRDAKSGTDGETRMSNGSPQTVQPTSITQAQTQAQPKETPALPKSRPVTRKVEGFSPIAPVPAAAAPPVESSSFSLEQVVRPNIYKLAPYRCARDDYSGPGFTFLDANENAFGASLGSDYIDRQQLNRYPDPNQTKVKELICDLRGGGLTPKNLFVGVGSDEAIDCVLRVFCVPGKEGILITPPTYGMYSVSATINDVEVVKVPLDPQNEFQPRTTEILEKLKADSLIKVLFLCSPGNPTSKLIDHKHIKSVLDSGWQGIVLVDEAYIDFSLEGSSVSSWVNSYPNLVVLQTMSKAFGLAAIRLGVAFTSPEIAKVMNAMKAPYNISTPTSELAIKALSTAGLKTMRTHVARLNASRETLADSLLAFKNVKAIVGGKEGNFIMAQIQTRAGQISNELALKIYEDMAQNRSVVVRFRGHEFGCEGCLRITIGTEDENELLLESLQRSFAKAQGDPEPVLPPRPQSKPSATGPVVPARPSKDSAPIVPRRPASATGNKDSPSIPARPTKTRSMPREEDADGKPPIAPRSIPGKLGGPKSAFAAALEAKLKGGPPLPKKKEVPPEEASLAEAVPQPLVDARKGRARGPAKRKPVATTTSDGAATTAETEPGSQPDADVDAAVEGGDVAESTQTARNKEGIEMRSQSVQTGVIEISTPLGDVTVLEGAGNGALTVGSVSTDSPGTDYIGQTVVVSKTDKEPSEDVKHAENEADKSSTVSPHAGGLEVPQISITEAAGGEVRSLEKNGFKPPHEDAPTQQNVLPKDELSVEDN